LLVVGTLLKYDTSRGLIVWDQLVVTSHFFQRNETLWPLPMLYYEIQAHVHMISGRLSEALDTLTTAMQLSTCTSLQRQRLLLRHVVLLLHSGQFERAISEGLCLQRTVFSHEYILHQRLTLALLELHKRKETFSTTTTLTPISCASTTKIVDAVAEAETC
jgi:hypothetical protein